MVISGIALYPSKDDTSEIHDTMVASTDSSHIELHPGDAVIAERTPQHDDPLCNSTGLCAKKSRISIMIADIYTVGTETMVTLAGSAGPVGTPIYTTDGEFIATVQGQNAQRSMFYMLSENQRIIEEEKLHADTYF